MTRSSLQRSFAAGSRRSERGRDGQNRRMDLVPSARRMDEGPRPKPQVDGRSVGCAQCGGAPRRGRRVDGRSLVCRLWLRREADDDLDRLEVAP